MTGPTAQQLNCVNGHGLLCRSLSEISPGRIAYLGEIIEWVGDDAIAKLLDAFASGKLSAVGVPSHGGDPEPIPQLVWEPHNDGLCRVSTLDGTLKSYHGGVVALAHRDAPFAHWKEWTAVGVEVSEVLKLWPKKGGTLAGTTKAYKQERVDAELKKLFAEIESGTIAWPSREEAIDLLCSRLPGLGKDVAKRRFSATRPSWWKPGPRPKPYHQAE